MTFTFYLGGYTRNNYRCKFNNNYLHCFSYDFAPFPEDEKIINLGGNKDWEKLLKFLINCNWVKTYEKEACDGTQWELKAETKTFKINSCGSNAYPEDFNRFLVLLNKVISETGMCIA